MVMRVCVWYGIFVCVCVCVCSCVSLCMYAYREKGGGGGGREGSLNQNILNDISLQPIMIQNYRS